RLPLELPDTRRYFALGFPSTAHYAETRFRIARTQAMEHVRVARALRQLPVLTKALEDGELSWSLLAEITRVATKDSEDEWLAFATKHGFHRRRAVAFGCSLACGLCSRCLAAALGLAWAGGVGALRAGARRGCCCCGGAARLWASCAYPVGSCRGCRRRRGVDGRSPRGGPEA